MRTSLTPAADTDTDTYVSESLQRHVEAGFFDEQVVVNDGDIVSRNLHVCNVATSSQAACTELDILCPIIKSHNCQHTTLFTLVTTPLFFCCSRDLTLIKNRQCHLREPRVTTITRQNITPRQTFCVVPAPLSNDRRI
jgi:hypothetical protein